MITELTFEDRLDHIKKRKLEHTQEKIRKYGRTMDSDDKGSIPLPHDFVFGPKLNHACGGFFGTEICGENFRLLLEAHPVYIDPMSSLAGGWMTTLASYRSVHWNPDFDFSHLHEEQKKYDLVHGIGASHHFTPDIRIGFQYGWGGILENLRKRKVEMDESHSAFYDGLENTVLGIQDFIKRHVDAAAEMAKMETNADVKKNLESLSEMNRRLINDPPKTFLEACQWVAWQIVTFNIYNGSGAALGSIDMFLKPFYDQDKHAKILDDEQAIFHLACLLIKDNTYYQIGGSDKFGNDKSNELSFLVLEAVKRLKIPTSICLRVHENLNPKLLEKAVDILFEDQLGSPNFIGDRGLNEGFMRNGYSLELAVDREKSGCHWCNIPGREYTLNDCVKINFVAVFDYAFREMMRDLSVSPSTLELWRRFDLHLKRAVEVIAEGLDFHLEHMQSVFPELPMDLLCYGPIEKGLDASHGGVEFYNMCVDGAGLAVVADSFAAIEQRIEKEGRISWEKLLEVIDNDYQGAENTRLMLKSVSRYGSGGSKADDYAVMLSRTFSEHVKEKTTPNGHTMIPGIFSWANTIPMGKAVGATPNGRHAFEPISHGANPEPGFREAGALTAMGVAVASVQCGYGNTVPIQLELDPLIGKSDGGTEKIMAFIKAYCIDLGGTLMNLNIISKETLLEAHNNPEKFPNLIVKVTGFSAYFASLSERFRQLVVDRIIKGL
ncbi:MAG: formate acetyltransferase [Vallitaleaceae bacterium]|nr:formate acetyltransferase [Vallitaleaceae bacterium]